MHKPLVSVIIPFHNSEKYLESSIKSIIKQKYRNVEIITIDDASTDSSSKVVIQLQKKDKRIKLLKNYKKRGPAISRNKGIKIAKGKYIAIQDADDISIYKRLTVEVDFLDKHNDIFLVGSRSEVINELGHLIKYSGIAFDWPDICKILPKKNCFIHSTIMFRNEKGLKYRDKFIYSQDYDFLLLLLSYGKKMKILNDVLLKYRDHDQSHGSRNRIYQNLFAGEARKFYIERVNHGVDNYLKFDPNSILKADYSNSLNNLVIEQKILDNLQKCDNIKLRYNIVKYFRNVGFLYKPIYLIYFVASFIGISRCKRILNLFRRNY